MKKRLIGVIALMMMASTLASVLTPVYASLVDVDDEEKTVTVKTSVSFVENEGPGVVDPPPWCDEEEEDCGDGGGETEMGGPLTITRFMEFHFENIPFTVNGIEVSTTTPRGHLWMQIDDDRFLENRDGWSLTVEKMDDFTDSDSSASFDGSQITFIPGRVANSIDTTDSGITMEQEIVIENNGEAANVASTIREREDAGMGTSWLEFDDIILTITPTTDILPDANYVAHIMWTLADVPF